MKYILIALLIIGLTLPALATEVSDVENYVEQNFMLKENETALDAAIRLLKRLKRIAPKRETVETSVVEKGKWGRTRQVYELRDKDTGKLISKRVEITSYYDTGEINLFIQRWFNAKGELLRERKIKHFRDGRQPKIMNVEPKPVER